MKFYVLQVRTKGEGQFIRLAEKRCANLDIDPEKSGKLTWPRRRLTIRRKGVKRDSLAPIFPGYVFLEIDELNDDIYWLLRKTNGFYRFLRDNQHVEPLSGEDERVLLHFLSYGEVVEKSKAVFDENQRIQIVDGPMKGLEGRIVKVDKRKGRAKVALTLYEDAFLIDFGFDIIEPAKRDEDTDKK